MESSGVGSLDRNYIIKAKSAKLQTLGPNRLGFMAFPKGFV